MKEHKQQKKSWIERYMPLIKDIVITLKAVMEIFKIVILSFFN